MSSESIAFGQYEIDPSEITDVSWKPGCSYAYKYTGCHSRQRKRNSMYNCIRFATVIVKLYGKDAISCTYNRDLYAEAVYDDLITAQRNVGLCFAEDCNEQSTSTGCQIAE